MPPKNHVPVQLQSPSERRDTFIGGSDSVYQVEVKLEVVGLMKSDLRV